MSEPRRPKGSPQGPSPDTTEDDDELAFVSPERLRETARISLLPGAPPPVVSPVVQRPPRPPSPPKIAQKSSATEPAAKTNGVRPPQDSDWDAPTKVIPSVFDEDAQPSKKAPRGSDDEDAPPTQKKQNPFEDAAAQHVVSPFDDPSDANARRSGVAAKSPSARGGSTPGAQGPQPGQPTRRPTLLGVGAVKLPNGARAIPPPASITTATPASSPVSSPVSSKISAFAPPLGHPSPSAPLPAIGGTAGPSRKTGDAAGPGRGAASREAAPSTTAETVRPSRVSAAQVALPPMVSPRMPPPLEPTPSRPPQRTGRETIPSQRGLTSQPPLPLPELMPSRPPARRKPSRLTLVAAVVVPLAIGIGAGLLFFKKPGGSSSETQALAGVHSPAPADSAAGALNAREGVPAAAANIAAPASVASRPELAGVESGDTAAMARLVSKSPSERSVTETLSLARGRVMAKQRQVEEFRRRFQKTPDVLKDPAELVRFRTFVEDRDTALLALATLAETPTPMGADILYDVWVGTRGRSETTWLAEQLVFSPEVRQAASKALQVALDLRTAQECEAVQALLPAAREHADARSMRQLKKLLVKRGCGPKGREDCFACLRPLDQEKDAVTVAEVIASARTRRAPKTR